MQLDISSEDVRLGLSLRDPVLWGEKYLINRDGTPRSYWSHQIEDLRCEDKKIIHLDGRDVGKSYALTTDALHFAFTTRGCQGLIAAPHQGHLDTLIEEIEFQLDSNPELMRSIAVNKYGKPKIARTPHLKITFTNGSVLRFRPAGAYGEAFRSLHVDRIWVDEGAWLSEQAWGALRQCLKSGGRLRIYSTPNGLRKTTYHRLTTASSFTVFHWPSWINPSWDDERERDLVEFYGGKESAGWQHEVAGEHGKPAYGAFSLDALSDAFQELDYRRLSILGEDLKDCESEEESFDRLEMLLNLVPSEGVYWIGGDLGYTNDPTELVVFKEEESEGRQVMKLVLRVHMEHVSYPHIAQVIGILDRFYTPAGIGVDNGGNGLAVVQELLTLDKYKQLDLDGRLHGYDFGGMTTLAKRDGKEVRKRTKEQMTSLIVGALQRKQIAFPETDSEIEDQFTTHTYTLSNSNVIYSKGNDHIIDAVRCAMLAHEQGSFPEESEDIIVSLTPLVTNPIFP
ncbi:MAG: terminase large subunit domain-containing protein [Armatimonadota bacterium]